MSTIKLSPDRWKLIRADLQLEVPKSVFMLRTKMKAVLGFTVREHSEWIDAERIEDFHNSTEGWHMGKKHQFSVCLDFYNERKYTMFILKYSEYLNKENK
jgi:hypothetical protein